MTLIFTVLLICIPLFYVVAYSMTIYENWGEIRQKFLKEDE